MIQLGAQAPRNPNLVGPSSTPRTEKERCHPNPLMISRSTFWWVNGTRVTDNIARFSVMGRQLSILQVVCQFWVFPCRFLAGIIFWGSLTGCRHSGACWLMPPCVAQARLSQLEPPLILTKTYLWEPFARGPRFRQLLQTHSAKRGIPIGGTPKVPFVNCCILATFGP